MYEIQEAEGLPVGTKIVVQLKTDCREFSDDETVKSKYFFLLTFITLDRSCWITFTECDLCFRYYKEVQQLYRQSHFPK